MTVRRTPIVSLSSITRLVLRNFLYAIQAEFLFIISIYDTLQRVRNVNYVTVLHCILPEHSISAPFLNVLRSLRDYQTNEQLVLT